MTLTGAPSPRPRSTFTSLAIRIIELNRQLDTLLLDRGIIGMARVRMFGTDFAADVVKKNDDGTYLMRARQHTARTAVGTEFTAGAGEVSLDKSELPNDSGQATLESARAAELAKLPSPSELRFLDGLAHPLGDGSAALESALAEERATLASPAAIITKHRQELAESAAHSKAGVSVQSGPM